MTMYSNTVMLKTDRISPNTNLPIKEETSVVDAFGPVDKKLTPKALARRIAAAREYLTSATNTFRHYDGEDYRVTGFHTDSVDGCVRVDYRSENHQGGSDFSTPLLRFISMVDDVQRMTPVYSVTRLESKVEIAERDGVDIETSRPIFGDED